MGTAKLDFAQEEPGLMDAIATLGVGNS
jgi:hypothetical protein